MIPEDEIYEPLERFSSEFREKFSRLAEETFERLRKESGVDVRANAELVGKIRVLESEKAKTEKRKAFRTGLIAISALIAAAGAGYGIFLWANEAEFPAPTLFRIAAGFAVAGLMIFLIFKYFLPARRRFARRIAELAAELSEKTAEAWNQMAPLNRLFTWDVMTKLIERTVPGIRFDPFFSEEALNDFRKSFGWDGSFEEEKSVLHALGGSLFGYPFVFAEFLSMAWEEKVYTGSRMITWTERVRDTDGKYRTVHRSEVLTASVTKPVPAYSTGKMLIYGNDAAPELSFSRDPSEFSGESGWFSSFGKKRELKKLHKFEQNLTDDSQYTMVGNREFEVLFHAVDRNDEVQFRFLFTPLAQQQMVKLLNDRKTGFGDDFRFLKIGKIDILSAEHLNGIPFDTDPRQFSNYEFAELKKFFLNRCETFFKALYFAFAPILTIPQYQEKRPPEPEAPDGKSSGNTASGWELESLANHFGEKKFEHPDCATRSILKARIVNRAGNGRATVSVRAHGFRGVPRTEIIPVYGGDKRWHNVAVEWVEYLPVFRDSTFEILEMKNSEAPDFADASKAEEINGFFLRHGMRREETILRRGILADFGK